MTDPVDDRALNRWTLARQMLLAREPVDAVTAISRLAGMQAQYSPSPFVGLWSRVANFDRAELERALVEDRVFKATLMRGTLHVVPAAEFALYRAATRNVMHLTMFRRLEQMGADVPAIRQAVLDAVAERPHGREELAELTAHLVPAGLPVWGGWSAVAVTGDVLNLAADASFGYFGGSRYRPAPPGSAPRVDAYVHVARAYLSAFGPASLADLSQWSGQPVSAFAEALTVLDTVSLRARDGRTLLDLADAPRPDPATPVPVRFLSKWDNLLLAHARRERVLPKGLQTTVIRRNGDVLPTFLVDGFVAGTWEAALRGPARMSLTPLVALGARARREVEAEAAGLLDWLRPDAGSRTVAWQTA